MKCDDARATFLAGEAGRPEMDHLSTCAACRGEWASLDDSLQTLADPLFWEQPPPGMEDRLVAMIAGSAVAKTHQAPLRRRRFELTLVAGAVAAVLVTALWIGARPPSPDWEVALPGTAEAPLASGVISGWNEAGGTRVALDIAGLPTAPDGYVYEFWFTRGDVHISAGTFKSPGDVELWVGVSRADYPRLWITLEPLDDDESPSARNVMDTAWPGVASDSSKLVGDSSYGMSQTPMSGA